MAGCLADLALEQGREVFAFPGNIFSSKSKGTNKLISTGAKLVDSIQDITEEFEMKIKISKDEISDENIINSLSNEEKKIYSILGFEKKHIDNIALESSTDITKLNSLLTFLELKGMVKQLSGKNFVRTK